MRLGGRFGSLAGACREEKVERLVTQCVAGPGVDAIGCLPGGLVARGQLIGIAVAEDSGHPFET